MFCNLEDARGLFSGVNLKVIIYYSIKYRNDDIRLYLTRDHGVMNNNTYGCTCNIPSYLYSNNKSSPHITRAKLLIKMGRRDLVELAITSADRSVISPEDVIYLAKIG